MSRGRGWRALYPNIILSCLEEPARLIENNVFMIRTLGSIYLVQKDYHIINQINHKWCGWDSNPRPQVAKYKGQIRIH